MGPFSGIDNSGTVANIAGWDASLGTFSPTSLHSLAAHSTADLAPISTAPSITDGHEDSEDIDEDKEPTDALSLKLTSLSQRTTQAIRNIVRHGRAPLNVSSPEVNEVLEDTNTLIRIVEKITVSDHDNATLDPTTTKQGLVLSALACHQQLVALFRAICDAILHSLQTKKQYQQHNRRRSNSDVESSSIAQFVMLLQLLMHLVNRMDRSLFQNNPSMWHSVALPTSGYITPVTPTMTNQNSMDPMQFETAIGNSSLHGGLLPLAQDIVRTIPNEGEKLRQIIQKLQTELEHSELR